MLRAAQVAKTRLHLDSHRKVIAVPVRIHLESHPSDWGTLCETIKIWTLLSGFTEEDPSAGTTDAAAARPVAASVCNIVRGRRFDCEAPAACLGNQSLVSETLEDSQEHRFAVNICVEAGTPRF